MTPKEKKENLKIKAREFKFLLEELAKNDEDAKGLLAWLTTLFERIDSGDVVPPHKYNHLMALGKEPDLFINNKTLVHAESEFISALEDWESQDWYKALNRE